MQPWKLRNRKTILSKPPWLTVEEHEIELPNGKVIPDWTWVNTPDFVNVLAVTTEGQFVCFRQTKYAIENTSLAPVGGYLEPGEDPLEAAKRELHEETGYEASGWTYFGKFAVDGNRGAGNAHLFLATGARKVSETHADDLEEMHLLLLSRDEIESALMVGEFKLVPWAACVGLCLLNLSHSAR